MAGERGGKILPLLLTQRARNKAEERELARRLGIRGFGDMTALLAAVSRPLVEMLRCGPRAGRDTETVHARLLVHDRCLTYILHVTRLCRISTVIRASSAALGVTMAERLRIYSSVAVRGLPPRGSATNRGGGGGGGGPDGTPPHGDYVHGYVRRTRGVSALMWDERQGCVVRGAEIQVRE